MRTHSVSHILTTYPRRRASPLALPLGELSPKVTERASLPLMYVLIRQLTKHISANALRFPYPYDIPAQSRLPPLALPLGELSPKVTERAFHLPMYVLVRELTKHIGANALRFPYPYDIPAQSRLPPLALPLGELSPKVTERVSLPPMYVLVRS